MKKYKVSYRGFSYVEADSLEEAKEVGGFVVTIGGGDPDEDDEED